MANSPAFVVHALDLLSLAGPVEARRMFGGHGLYTVGVMFGLLDDDELFLKTDAETRARFVEAGCKAWVYPRRDGRVEQTSYFQPPDGAHEEPEAMLPWARLAMDAALRARAEKDARGRKRKGRAPGKRRTAPAKRSARRAR